MKIEVGLFDGSFVHQKSATLGGENTEEEPKWINWIRNEVRPVTFFTDMRLKEAPQVGNDITKIAWLLEPPSLSDTHYILADEMKDEFDCILTFDREAVAANGYDKIYYALGGSWIPRHQFGLQSKGKLLSIIATQKVGAVGHRLRRACADLIITREVGHVYGRGYNPIDSKTTALKDYAYSVVVESINMKGYFSEKLIDCLSQGTVPIYCGCPNIGEFFDLKGMITFRTLEELDIIIDRISAEDYLKRIPSILENLNRCDRYRCAEDWIFRSYPYIFEQCEKKYST